MQNFRQQLLKTTKQIFDFPERHFPAFYEHNWERPSHAKKNEKHSSSNAEVMYRRQRMALAQARKPYLTVLLFTYDRRVISVQFL